MSIKLMAIKTEISLFGAKAAEKMKQVQKFYTLVACQEEAVWSRASLFAIMKAFSELQPWKTTLPLKTERQVFEIFDHLS